MELKTYKQKVEKILEDHESARNSDGTMIAYYINTYHKNLVTQDTDGEPAVSLRHLKDLPPVESLTRARRIIQNDDQKYPPTDPKVVKARKIKEENYRNCEVREAVLF